MFDGVKATLSRMVKAVEDWTSVGVVVKDDRVFVDGKESLGHAKLRELKRMRAFFIDMETEMERMDGALTAIEEQTKRELAEHFRLKGKK